MAPATTTSVMIVAMMFHAPELNVVLATVHVPLREVPVDTSRLMDLEYDGLPKDWLQQIRDKVVKLTKEDIQRAAKAHFNPDRLRILAVGSGEALSKVLAGFGEVKEITLAPES